MLRRSYFGRPPRIYLPTPKPKKEFKLPIRQLKLLLFLVILFGIFYLLFLSPVFVISRVDISGTSNQEIKQTCEESKGKNLWLYNTKKLRESLKSYAEVNETKITRWPPKTLKVKIVEKKEGIIWVTQGKQYLLDISGFVVKEVEKSDLPRVLDSKNLPVEAKKQILAPEFVNFVRNLNFIFSQKTGLRLVECSVPESIFELWVKTDTITLKLDPLGNLDTQLDYFNRVFSEKKGEIKEYIDLTTWDKGIVVYK